MKNLLFILSVILVWVFSLVNTSGLGLAYDTPTKTNIVICLWCLTLILSGKDILLKVFKANTQLVRFTVLSFVIFPLLIASSWEGLTYLMMVPLVYCFSEQKVTTWAMNISGYAVAGLGLFILYVFKNTGILSGWNYNHISMIGLFSYIYYSISLYGNMSGKKLTIGVAISLLYIMMLSSMNSRSSIIFIMLSVLFAYKGDWLMWLLKKKRFVFFALNVPIIISLICILFPNLFIFQYFGEWSMENFGKSAMNGRDKLWLEAYNELFDSYFLGEGEFLINYHNSGVAVLSVFGVIGYICWYKLLARPMQFIRLYASDSLMLGFISSFLLIFWQQSFELGFVNASPNMIPYMILGLGIARARGIRQRQQHKTKSLHLVNEQPPFIEPFYLFDKNSDGKG